MYEDIGVEEAAKRAGLPKRNLYRAGVRAVLGELMPSAKRSVDLRDEGGRSRSRLPADDERKTHLWLRPVAGNIDNPVSDVEPAVRRASP